MLVLSRKKNESVIIDGGITVTVLDIRGDKVRLGLTAPLEVRIARDELLLFQCETKSSDLASVA